MRIRPKLLAGLLLAATWHAPALAETCSQPGKWYSTQENKQLTTAEVVDYLADASFILLGERHDSSAHHRWQLHVLAALLGRDALAAVGFEMFPRTSQAAVDDWIAGKSSIDAFLTATDWNKVWGFSKELYTPLFHFVRMHQIPSQALNVDRSTIRSIREQGLANLAAKELEGVGKPAEPHEDYREQLTEVLHNHPGDIDLEQFLEVQTFWDRAMAEGLQQAHAEHGSPVAAIIGEGHAQHDHGIPFQLEDLGHDEIVVLLPHQAGEPCPNDNRADFLFTLTPDQSEGPKPPRMGIAMQMDEEQRIMILEVLSDTPAAAAGLAEGDRILRAAGQKLDHPHDLQQTVAQQPPGTWLPLLIDREGAEQQKIIKFPTNEDR